MYRVVKMGCNIHLYVEKRSRQGNTWFDSSIRDFSERSYKMFAALNNVRNDFGITPLEYRGFPHDGSFIVTRKYFSFQVVDNVTDSDNQISKEEAGLVLPINKISIGKNVYCVDPDWHSPNWCTLKELQECYNRVSDSCSIEWLAIISYMTTLELYGDYETRAVFWFDN